MTKGNSGVFHSVSRGLRATAATERHFYNSPCLSPRACFSLNLARCFKHACFKQRGDVLSFGGAGHLLNGSGVVPWALA